MSTTNTLTYSARKINTEPSQCAYTPMDIDRDQRDHFINNIKHNVNILNVTQELHDASEDTYSAQVDAHQNTTAAPQPQVAQLICIDTDDQVSQIINGLKGATLYDKEDEEKELDAKFLQQISSTHPFTQKYTPISEVTSDWSSEDETTPDISASPTTCCTMEIHHKTGK